MSPTKKNLTATIAIVCLITACQEDNIADPEIQFQAHNHIYTKYDYERGENYEQTAMVLLDMIQKNPDLVQKITHLVLNERPEQANIHFKDLLEPEKSTISNYRTYNVSSFTSAFRNALIKGDYPNAKKFPTASARNNSESLEDFLKKEGASIYMPYIEDTDPNELPTIAFASVENSGDRVKGYRLISSSGTSGNHTASFSFEEVIVDDDYSYEHQTWIIQPDDQYYIITGDSSFGRSGGDDAGRNGGANFRKMEVLQVNVGDLKVTKQYDPYVGLFNSGASEIVFFRGDVAYDPNSATKTAVPFTQLISVSRSDIRNEKWVNRSQVWDPNWTEKGIQQVFGIYEWDDTKSKIKISGEAKKKVKVKIDKIAEVEQEISAKVEFEYSSDNTLITNQNWMYEIYKKGNKTANGHGTRNGWRVYACDAVYFTKPYSIFHIDED